MKNIIRNKEVKLALIYGLIFFVSTAFLAVIVYLLARWISQANTFGATRDATVVYAIVSIATLFTLIIAAVVAYNQLNEIQKTRKLEVMLALCRWYSSDEMCRAVREVAEWRQDKMKPEVFVGNESRDLNRRRVSDFWRTVGAMARAELIDLEFIRMRFRDPSEILANLKYLETAKRKRIEENKIKESRGGNRRRALSEHERGEAKVRAEEHVVGQSQSWLYEEWNRRFPKIENAAGGETCLEDQTEMVLSTKQKVKRLRLAFLSLFQRARPVNQAVSQAER